MSCTVHHCAAVKSYKYKLSSTAVLYQQETIALLSVGTCCQSNCRLTWGINLIYVKGDGSNVLCMYVCHPWTECTFVSLGLMVAALAATASKCQEVSALVLSAVIVHSMQWGCRIPWWYRISTVRVVCQWLPWYYIGTVVRRSPTHFTESPWPQPSLHAQHPITSIYTMLQLRYQWKFSVKAT